MSPRLPSRRTQTLGEEIANSITHGIAAVLSVAALVALVMLAAGRGTAWHIVAVSIYGGALVLLYVNSTLYHSFPWPETKAFWRRLDHASIYVLIAGTYTPFTLVCMRNTWGWLLFGLIWGLALFGIVFKTFCMGRCEVFSTTLYVAMGWVALIALRPIIASVPAGALWLLLAGGVCYTLGVVFYVWRRLPYHHTVWHGFVMGGSACHFLAVLFFIIPGAA